MCLIIDNCVRDKCFSKTPHEDALPILDWLTRGNGCLVFGGKLRDELFGSELAKRFIIELKRAGRAFQIADQNIEDANDQEFITANAQSNDHHVLALAVASGSRVLFTHDIVLERDFKNKKILDQPRGKIYKKESHKRLLAHSSSCFYSKRAKTTSK